MLAGAAFGMPGLVIGGRRKAVSHCPPIGRLGPAAARVAAVEADHRLPDAEIFATKAVIVLGIVARVAEGRVDPNEGRGLSHGWGEIGRVLARVDTRHRAQDEVGVGMNHGGELGPGALPMTRAPAAQPEVGAHVPRLEPGRVQRGDRRRIDQAAPVGAPDHHGLSAAEGPPAWASARMRREAWARVEKCGTFVSPIVRRSSVHSVTRVTTPR